MILKRTEERSYFAACNSAGGFHSFYGACFDAPRVGEVYAVKGGPGTGKSRFLREIAAVAAGQGWKLELIYCSSDPDSLDGVILSGEGRCVALLDATAPHVYEPARPGVREELLNLGAFWDREALRGRAKEIQAHQQAKEDAYRMAYRYLAAAGEVEKNRREAVSKIANIRGIDRFADKLLRGAPSDGRGELSPALMSSIGMKGEVMLDCFCREAGEIFLVEECHGAGALFLERLTEHAKERRMSAAVSYDPLLPSDPNGIFFTESKAAFLMMPPALCPYPHKILSLRRFLRGEKRDLKLLGEARKARRMLMESALGMFERVRDSHFALEEIYIAAMDFSAKENFTKSFAQQLFGLQNC